MQNPLQKKVIPYVRFSTQKNGKFVKLKSIVKGSRKYGVKWKEGCARARTIGNRKVSGRDKTWILQLIWQINWFLNMFHCV